MNILNSNKREKGKGRGKEEKEEKKEEGKGREKGTVLFDNKLIKVVKENRPLFPLSPFPPKKSSIKFQKMLDFSCNKGYNINAI